MSDNQQTGTATRRRWLTIAEISGAGALVISALSFWDSRTQRETEQQEKAVDQMKQESRATALTLVARPDKNGDQLALSARSDDQLIQSQTLTFPADLGLSAIETAGDSRIEAKWFDSELHDALKQRAAPKSSKGDARIPVVIVTRYVTGDKTTTDRGLYDIAYTRRSGFFGGDGVSLRSLSRVGTVTDANAAARLAARWNSIAPPAPKDGGEGENN